MPNEPGTPVERALAMAETSPHPIDIDIPDALRPSVRRHQDNLMRLITTCRTAGIADREIEDSVTTVINSYRDELIAAIKQLSTPPTPTGGA
jgi:hypothetical protein